MNTNWKPLILIAFWLIATSGCGTCFGGSTQSFILQILGKNSVKIIRSSTKVEMVTLRVIAARKAENATLRSDKTILGYPFDGNLVVIKREQALKLIKILLQRKNYNDKIARRCANRYLIGIRFSQDKQKVEFALGLDCQQAIWAFRSCAGLQHWGAVFGDIATKKLLRLLGK